jgi:hypothetical protein
MITTPALGELGILPGLGEMMNSTTFVSDGLEGLPLRDVMLSCGLALPAARLAMHEENKGHSIF